MLKWVHIRESNPSKPYSPSLSFLGLQDEKGTVYTADDYNRPQVYNNQNATIAPYKGLIGVEAYMFFVRTKEHITK